MSGAASAQWGRYWRGIGNEHWLAAKELLDVSPRVRHLFMAFLVVERDSAGHAGAELDWNAAADQVERDGLSSTEYRLARIVAALTTGRPVDLESLALMGSWQGEVWRVLVQWGTDGAFTTVSTTGGPSSVLADASRPTEHPGAAP